MKKLKDKLVDYIYKVFTEYDKSEGNTNIDNKELLKNIIEYVSNDDVESILDWCRDEFDKLRTNYNVDSLDEMEEQVKEEHPCYEDLNNLWNVLNEYKDGEKSIKYFIDLLNEYSKKNNIDEEEKDMEEKREVEIINIYGTEDDIRCQALLKINNEEVASVIASYDESDLRYSIGDSESEMDEEFVKNAFTFLITGDFDTYLSLPRISECSKLLQEIFDGVSYSESSMFHITKDEWEKIYSDKFNESDIQMLKDEIEKFNLKDSIELDNSEYKIVGYSRLETEFNDDRYLNIDNSYEPEMEV